MSPQRVSACIALAVALAFFPASQAAGETVTKNDRRNDAAPQVDMTKVTYTYDTSTVSVDARIPGLKNGGDAQFSVTQFETFEAGYVGRIRRTPGSTPKVGLFYFDHFGFRKRPCADITGTWKAGRIRINVPVTCLIDGFPSERVSVEFGVRAQRGGLDRAPAVKRLTQTP